MKSNKILAHVNRLPMPTILALSSYHPRDYTML